MLGEVIGFRASTDAFHPSAPEPTGAIAARAIEGVLESADLGLGDVDYINSHGSASHHNDIAETRAIKLVFGEAALRPGDLLHQVGDWSPDGVCRDGRGRMHVDGIARAHSAPNVGARGGR